MTELTDPHIQEAVAAARELRRQFGASDTEPLDRDLLECVEGELGLAVCIAELPFKMAGAYIRRRARSFIFIRAGDYPTRQRFTIAHELGHHQLGHGAVVDSERDVGRDTSDPREQQANYFASELLHPVEAVQRWLDEKLGNGTPPTITDLVHLAYHFHVSPPAMLYRLSKGEYAGIDRAVLNPLWDQVKEHRHMEISEQLGIGHGSDAISAAFDAGDWPRLPAGVASAEAAELAEAVRNCFPAAASESDDAVDPPETHQATQL